MNVIGLIVQKTDGSLVQMAAQAVETPLTKTKELAGPFNVEFNLNDKKGEHEFKGRALIGAEEIIIGLETYPIAAHTKKAESARGNILKYILELNDRGEYEILKMEPRKMFSKGKMVVLRIYQGSVTAYLLEEDGTSWVIPFYNFYESGAICMGNLRLNGSPLAQAFQVLCSMTTPHETWDKKKYQINFRAKDDRVIETEGRMINNGPIDLPEMKEYNQRLLAAEVIGTLTP